MRKRVIAEFMRQGEAQIDAEILADSSHGEFIAFSLVWHDLQAAIAESVKPVAEALQRAWADMKR